MTLLDSNCKPSVEPNELVRLALLGSQDAANAIVDHFRPRLVFVIAKRLRGTTIDPEDVVQESLAKAFQQILTFNPKYQFSTWLFTIAFHTASDAVRKHIRRPSSQYHDLDSVAAKRIAPESDDNSHTIWNVAQSALVQSQFEVLWLRFGEQLSIADVAKILNKTQVGVRVLLHRARSKLQFALEKEGAMAPSSRADTPELKDGTPIEQWGT